MYLKKILSSIHRVSSLMKNINKNKQENVIYRIIDIENLPYGKFKLIVQVIGKSTIFECDPNEIVIIDRIIEGFSKKDVRTITYLTCAQNVVPKYKIIAQEFCEILNKILFKLSKINNDSVTIKTANQIMIDKKIFNNLSKEDTNSVIYVAGYECFQNENFIKK